jgi:hypothetical protein
MGGKLRQQRDVGEDPPLDASRLIDAEHRFAALEDTKKIHEAG